MDDQIKPHKLPKQENVLEFAFGKTKVILVKRTDENKEYLINIALSMYLGEKCKYCLREFNTLDDLKDCVYAGYHNHGRIACKSCWEENNTTN